MATKARSPGLIKSTLQRWLGSLSEAPAASVLFDGQETSAGVSVSFDRALTLSAVWACTRLVSQTIATLPLGLYERLADGHRASAEQLPLARLLARPNSEQTAVTFWEGLVGQALLLGNGFAEKKRLDGRVVALEPLSTERLSWRRVNGAWEFVYAENSVARRTIAEDDLFHVPGFSMGGRFGMSVIRYGAEVFGAAIAGNLAAGGTFKRGLMPTVGFKMERVIGKAQRKEFRDDFQRNVTGAMNAGTAPLLEGGMEAFEIGIDPKDAQLLESRAFSIEEVCRWFGVPPSMIGSTDKASSWASSSEQLNLWFLQYGLRPWLKRIEEAIRASLLTPVEQTRYYAEFSVEGLLRADTKARAEFYASALQNGYINRATVARLENLPEPDGGEIYTVQRTLVPIDQLGAKPIAPGP